MAKQKQSLLPARTASEVAATYAVGGAARDEVVAWYTGVVAQAEAGDRAALRQALAIAEAVPGLLSVRSLQKQAEGAYLDRLTGKERLLSRYVLRQEIETLHDALAGPNPSPLERLLVDRVVLCYLDCQYAEITLAGKLGQNLPLAQLDFLQRWAERRYLAAIKTLATVRRLMQPVMQVIIGEKQVNVVR